MPQIQIVREVRLPPAEAWQRLTDWAAHGRFVPLTTVTVTHEGFVARTGFRRLGFDDPMELVDWDPPTSCRLEKGGRVVLGWAELRVDPLADGCRVTWREQIRVRGVPRLFDALTGAVAARLFARVIDGLLG